MPIQFSQENLLARPSFLPLNGLGTCYDLRDLLKFPCRKLNPWCCSTVREGLGGSGNGVFIPGERGMIWRGGLLEHRAQLPPALCPGGLLLPPKPKGAHQMLVPSLGLHSHPNCLSNLCTVSHPVYAILLGQKQPDRTPLEHWPHVQGTAPGLSGAVSGPRVGCQDLPAVQCTRKSWLQPDDYFSTYFDT